MVAALELIENKAEKGENAGYKHFFPFHPLFFQRPSFAGLLKVRIVLEGVHPFPNKPWFLGVFTSLLKTLWEKEELLVTSNFSSSHNVFYLSGDFSANFIQPEIAICKLFRFERV